MENLFKRLNAIEKLSEAFKEYLARKLLTFEFGTGEQLPYRPPVSTTIYFIEYGLVSGLTVSEQKTAKWFINDGHFILPSLSTHKKPLIERIEFLSQTLLIGLELNHATHAIEIFPEAKWLFLALQDERIHDSHQRELFLRLTADVRYAHLYKKLPMLFIDGHTEKLASYLNISRRHFARIKRKHTKTAF